MKEGGKERIRLGGGNEHNGPGRLCNHVSVYMCCNHAMRDHKRNSRVPSVDKKTQQNNISLISE